MFFGTSCLEKGLELIQMTCVHSARQFARRLTPRTDHVIRAQENLAKKKLEDRNFGTRMPTLLWGKWLGSLFHPTSTPDKTRTRFLR